MVHEKRYINELKFLSLKKESSFPDNPFSENTFEIAKLAAGASFQAGLHSFKKFSFALLRPPGHHAGKDFFGGFCYLNNIAFAIRKLQKIGKINRGLIIDFDVHHGNGTQDIFYNDENVFYLSFHQNPKTIYPFSGFESENNEHIKNVILEPGIDDESYKKIFQKNVKKYIKEFKPDIIGISAGFDTYARDVVCGNQLRISSYQTYFELGKIIKEEASSPIFAVLEGGYYLDGLGESVYNFMSAFL